MEDSLRDLQLAELCLLKELDKICREKEIPYYVMGGTLLGAVRHKGFIPWDDDIDIGIPRPYYDKLDKILDKEEYKYLRYRNFHNDSSYIRFFSRIESTKVRVVRYDKKVAEESYAWIDIFPLDALPNNKVIRKLVWLRFLMLRAEYRISDYNHLIDITKKNRPLIERIIISVSKFKIIQRLFDTKKMLDKMERLLAKYNYKKSNYLVNAMGVAKTREIFHKKYYGEGAEYEFEDMIVPGPINYDYILRQLYGDYMTPPKQADLDHHKLRVIYH